MSSINPETVVSVLKDQIENYDQKTEVKEEGRIIQIADGSQVSHLWQLRKLWKKKQTTKATRSFWMIS